MTPNGSDLHDESITVGFGLVPTLAQALVVITFAQSGPDAADAADAWGLHDGYWCGSSLTSYTSCRYQSAGADAPKPSSAAALQSI